MSSPFEVDVSDMDVAVDEGEEKKSSRVRELLGLEENKQEGSSMAERTVFDMLVEEGNFVVDAPRDLWDACGHFKVTFEVVSAEEIFDVLAACSELFDELREVYGVEQEEEDEQPERVSRNSRRSSRSRDTGRRSSRRSSSRRSSSRGGRNDGDFSNLDDSPGSMTPGQENTLEELAMQFNQSLGDAMDWYAEETGDDDIPYEPEDLSKQQASDMIGWLINQA